MRTFAPLGMLAMVPAALNPALAASPAALTLTVPSCAGMARVVTLPLNPGGPAPAEQQPCCNKGCHGGSSRKRLIRAI
jgi:hypothetical protein